MPTSTQRAPWQTYGGQYRSISNLSRPWVASPVVPPPPSLPFAKIHLPLIEPSDDGTIIRSERRQRNQKLWKAFKRLIGASAVPPDDVLEAEYLDERVPLSEWKAYGYYACPYVNGVHVRNLASEHVPPTDVDIDEIFNSLRSPRGDHPERWIPGLQHSALPPRPTRWREPNPLEPLPFPWECQLNPFLEHKLFGLPPVYFDIGRMPTMLMHGSVDTAIPLTPADKAQPATWPFLTHMFINAIGDDPIHPFLWPLMVKNPKGIKCEDIYQAIYDNFQQYVSQSEYDDWPQPRQEQCLRAYRGRVAPQTTEGTQFVEGIRRIDFMGDRVMFRGLEPNPNIDGWVMFVGTAW